MAFGFLGNTKVGPGVDKNRMEKKRLFRFFELYFRKFGRLMYINLLYTLFMLPSIGVAVLGFMFVPGSLSFLGVVFGIALMGPPTCGFTYLLRQLSLERPVFIWHDFIEYMKNNFKQSLLFSCLDAIVLTVVGISVHFSLLQFDQGAFQYILLILYVAVAIIVLNMHYYIYLMMITLDLRIPQLIKNSLILTLAAIKTNLITTFFIFVLVIIPFLFIPLDFLLAFVAIFTPLFYASLIGFIVVFNSFPHVKRLLVDPYYEAHPEARKNNVFGDTWEEEEDEPIFTDLGTLEPKSELTIKTEGRGGKTVS